jgi:transcriptional regulator of heat shock response
LSLSTGEEAHPRFSVGAATRVPACGTWCGDLQAHTFDLDPAVGFENMRFLVSIRDEAVRGKAQQEERARIEKSIERLRKRLKEIEKRIEETGEE